MKVLVLSHISELLGGAERSMLDVFDYWAAHYDVQPEFILREPLKSLAPEITKRGWKYYPLSFTFWSDGKPPTTNEEILHNVTQNTKAVKEIEKIIERTKPDLVMTNSIVSPWAALAAHFQQVPHVWFIREYGDLDHGRVFEIGREKTFEDVGNLSALVVTNSNTLANHVRQYISKEKVTALYNPFNLEQIKSKASEKVKNPFQDKSSLKLVLTGNIARSKGQLEAIQAVGLLNNLGKNIELCLIGRSGDRDFSQELEEKVKGLGIEKKIHFVGYQTNPLAFVALADIGIMPSRMEAFGRVTFEYLAVGKPIIGSNSGATPEMVKEGANGYLFDAENVESLAEALKHYTDRPDLIKKHGQTSEKLANKMMHGNSNVDVLYKKIEKIVSTKFEPSTEPINYMNHWLKYNDTSKNIHSGREMSLSRLLRVRVRRLLKAVYIRGQRAKAKVTKH